MNADALADLRDIHLPPAPDLTWPLMAVGAGLLGLLWLLGAWLVWRRYRRRAPLRLALRELAGLARRYAEDGDADRLLARLSSLVRGYACERFPADQVAGLVGGEWLAFLDRHLGANLGASEFSSGPGAALAWRPYCKGGEIEAAALIELIGRWLRSNPP